ncbi:sodium/calcium exchanger protein [Mycoplasma haemocanis str. Illinois]|uniref:Sodium/calcium exchanger protein n=1 Tax=Mycoplasma haemocanis (strain Illinois) TaxID=1111676 RepID=H6N5U1_MYCHN|nr:sodium:calcium antiporter [Mycoplasma haemocanis]AEW45051.2 sodium/calcium exchanger protein [Mycoplasma haemocanis str. Illinois]
MTVPLLFAFLSCFIGIIVTAYWSIESIKAISIKYKLSDTFVGAVFLSVGTSFPEFVNSIVSGFHDKYLEIPRYAMYSFYNVTGANTWQVVFLSVALSLITIKTLFQKKSKDIEDIQNIFWKESIFSWELVFWETVFLCIIFLAPFLFSKFLFRGFSVINVVFLLVWFWYLHTTYKDHPEVEKRDDEFNHFSSWNKPSLLGISLLLWCLFGALSYANFYIASKFPISGNFSFGIILSFVTSTPEFSALFFLFRKKEYRIAVGGFFGSSLFNLTLPAYTNWISGKPLIGKHHSISHDGNPPLSTNKLSFWLILNLFLLVLFLMSFYKPKFLKRTMIFLNGIVVAALYVFLNIKLNEL